MPLSKEDLDAIGQLFDARVKLIEDRFTDSLQKMGKRVDRLEAGFSEMTRVARSAVTTKAREKHDGLLRAMFDESTLVAVPPLQEDQHGKFSRPAAPCTIDDVTNKLSNLTGDEVKFEVEPTNVGYRILLASFSSQTRRKNAAKIIQTAKKELKDSLGLLLQYDKPYELRMMQKQAYKFLSVLEKRANGAVKKKQLKNGYLVINDVRIAPEYLVPGNGRWDELADVVISKIRAWRGKPPSGVETGVLTDVFGLAYAEDFGVFDLGNLEMGFGMEYE
jgi:hypothetical protein